MQSLCLYQCRKLSRNRSPLKAYKKPWQALRARIMHVMEGMCSHFQGHATAKARNKFTCKSEETVNWGMTVLARCCTSGSPPCLTRSCNRFATSWSRELTAASLGSRLPCSRGGILENAVMLTLCIPSDKTYYNFQDSKALGSTVWEESCLIIVLKEAMIYRYAEFYALWRALGANQSRHWARWWYRLALPAEAGIAGSLVEQLAFSLSPQQYASTPALLLSQDFVPTRHIT